MRRRLVAQPIEWQHIPNQRRRYRDQSVRQKNIGGYDHLPICDQRSRQTNLTPRKGNSKMRKIIDNIKSHVSDWLASSKSKRLLAAVIVSVVTTVGTNDGWMTEQQALNIAGIVIAAILGDSYRPMNPNKVTE
jgi:hypothetical protein